MKFCPKCGRIMIIRDDKYVCSFCGYEEKIKKERTVVFSEDKNNTERMVVLEGGSEGNLPIEEDIECPKCGNKGAYFWTMQTRASDEAETKFYKCVKCGYVWRVYD
ncbi:transcription factor S [Nanoarchaeota archaeon NZ13-N]|uniref:Transcription factor S n=1 Tax=Candidatus Nanoclepta minutus TaxID=1940235 RepID=A0A397WQX0_9ARCH|nr:MAG: transcription factor S [Nanoarchaeota archaeon NZ13-N]RIB35066.1 MAG: transcription factor S [Candidatus Nanoclepta minutus]